MNQPQLRDIHLPEAGGWWPPAPGWWVLLGMLLLLAYLAPRLWRRLRRRSLRRQSLLELRRIRDQYDAQHSKNQLLAELAALLRRTLIAYQGRDGYAASTGEAWLAQLRTLSPQAGFTTEQLALLGHDRYRRRRQFDVDQLLATCERWIAALPRRPDDVSA